MNLGKSYSIRDFAIWSRRKFYAAFVCSTVPVLLYHSLGMTWLAIPIPVVVLLGTATSFIVGFRNVQTYSRVIDAQQIWAEIVNGSRCFGVMSRDFVSVPATGRALILRHCAWLTALRYQLRTPKIWESLILASNIEYQKYYSVPEWETPLEQALARYLSAAEIDALLRAENPAIRLLSDQSAAIKRALDDGELSNGCYMELSSTIRNLFNQQGRAERIKNYPYPRQYAVINRLFVRTFCALLPFGILAEFAKLNANVSGVMHGHMIWLAVPFGTMIAWMYLVLEQVGESTENPFEGSPNDIPMAQLSRRVERELMDMLGETCDLAELPAERGIVL